MERFGKRRFKANLVQSERYLLELYRYIELNPVKAGIVDEPGQYSWSSYACNAPGIKTELQPSRKKNMSKLKVVFNRAPIDTLLIVPRSGQ